MLSNYRGQITVPRRFVKVKMEGVPNMFFDSPQVPPLTQNNPSETAVDTTEEEQDPASNICRDLAEDIALVRNQGYDVDDDNKPAPENVPNANATFNFGLYPDQQWGESMFVNPMANTGYKSPPGFVDFDINNATYLEIFFKFFPFKWLIDVLLVETNKNLSRELTMGELIRYLGLRLSMASVGRGFSTNNFFSTEPFHPVHNPCPYNFRSKMLKKRFKQITAALSFTNKAKPTCKDRFWEVRQIIDDWNKNMAAVFLAGWILCLNESMSIWFLRWTCPGWVFCPRKPHSFGNEYHSACCALSSIMFAIKLVEGKDRPPKGGAPEFDSVGKTGGLLLQMLQCYFHWSVRCVGPWLLCSQSHHCTL